MTESSQLLLTIAGLAFMTGVTSKFADLLNEHGVIWFSHAATLSGIVWAALAGWLTIIDSVVAALWVGTVLYWFLALKLDHLNHALAGVVVVLCGLGMTSDAKGPPFLGVLAILVWLSVSGVVNRWAKRTFTSSSVQIFLRLRLRYYVGPLVLGISFGTVTPIVAIIFGMLGTELVTISHARMAADGRRREWAGLRYVPEEDMSR